MAIDIQSLFNPGSLQQMAETEDEKKKRAQITGTMNFGGQSGTFNGNFDPSLFQQQTNTSPSAGYQPPPNYGMSAPPEQQPVPVIQPPVFTPPVGSNPISGEYNIPDQQPVPLPPGNQPYVAPPAEPYQAPPPEQYGGGFGPKFGPGPGQQDDYVSTVQDTIRTIQQQQQEAFNALPQDEQQRQIDAQREFFSQQQQQQQQIFAPPDDSYQLKGPVAPPESTLPPGTIIVPPSEMRGGPGWSQPPGTMPDYDTMSQEDFKNKFGFDGFGSDDMWGNSYNALKNSDIGRQYTQGNKDWWALKRSVMDQTTGRPDNSIAQTQGWDAFNQQEQDYFNRVDQGMQQDSRYTSLSPYGKTNMFPTYLGQQGKTLDPSGSNQDLQNFLAADTYFKRFVEPNLQIGFNSGSGPVAPGGMGFVQ